jgi:hypothetical protein
VDSYEKILLAYYRGLIRREYAIIYIALAAGTDTATIAAMFDERGI